MKLTLIITSLALLLSACSTSKPYRCTSRNAEVCDLQKRMVRLEDAHAYPRQKSIPVTMTDKELIDELRRRKAVVTYPQ